MVRAIRVHETGGPEVMRFEEVEIGEPGAGEARVRHEAIGLNFIDTYFRSGLYPAPAGLPMTPGNEGAGTVVAVGPDVTEVKVGDRVAYVGPLGSYAEERLVPADRLVKLPGEIDSRTAAGMMLKGMTASYLLKDTFKVGPGTTLLFHAAAGGVGLIAGQWAKHLGATVIGTVGSPEKAELARAHGYEHVIDYTKENFVERVAEITGGAKCDVVYDSVGNDTYPGSLDCLKPLGMWVSFGQSSGPIRDFNLALLGQKGSLFATRPTLFTYVAQRADLERTANDLFDVVASGAVKIQVNQTYALADAVKAHQDLEGRRTTGTTVLLP
ncbi:NADPH2:quinone reductase [Breoghania corrubedonensis]|uniref:NADPH2:quinone reductase n=1 Tax=Breoghania corrubedonensis TaxID=665038 RepID=A0A2T5V8P6_9HYPH|nr:quinone oxidoreductase [Breoghania corrubedonensis]PTW60128.1 NADPH2:quinone reductase [Breoghania corrubedonensis]